MHSSGDKTVDELRLQLMEERIEFETKIATKKQELEDAEKQLKCDRMLLSEDFNEKEEIETLKSTLLKKVRFHEINIYISSNKISNISLIFLQQKALDAEKFKVEQERNELEGEV